MLPAPWSSRCTCGDVGELAEHGVCVERASERHQLEAVDRTGCQASTVQVRPSPTVVPATGVAQLPRVTTIAPPQDRAPDA